jgi:hypothetical protein
VEKVQILKKMRKLQNIWEEVYTLQNLIGRAQNIEKKYKKSTLEIILKRPYICRNVEVVSLLKYE